MNEVEKLLKETIIRDSLEAPAALAKVPQWVLYRAVPDEKRVKKVPYQANGQPASTTDPSTWTTHRAAVDAYLNGGGFSGIGFVFTEDDGLYGIDLDNALDSKGRLRPWARDIVERFRGTYIEVSPSDRGLHVFGLGKLSPSLRKKIAVGDGHIEAYDRERYFTFTGNRFEDTRNVVCTVNGGLTWLIGKHLDRTKDENDLPVPVNTGLIDREVLVLAKRNPKFKAAWDEGDIGPWANDHSTADFFVCTKLAYYTGWDTERMDALFRQSALMRPKWDERRGSQTYGEWTIEKAARSQKRCYELKAEDDSTAPEVLSLSALMENPDLLKPPVQVTKYLGWQEKSVLLWGREKGGKSTLMSAEAALASREGKRILWISSEEDLASVAARLNAYGPEPANVFVLSHWPRAWSHVENAVQETQPDVVYVDSVTQLVPKVEPSVPHTSDAEKWGAIFLRFKEWAMLHKCAVVITAHARKDETDYSGSHAKGAAVDMLVKFARGKTGSRVNLTYLGRWSVGTDNVRTVRWIDGHYDLDFIEPPARLDGKSLRDAIMEYIRKESGCSKNQVCSAIAGGRNEILKQIDELIGQGWIVNEGTSNASRLRVDDEAGMKHGHI